MPVIERPGARVAYDVVGSGPPIVLGHSLFCTRSMWRGVVPRLADRFRLINVELRGHGESTAESPCSGSSASARAARPSSFEVRSWIRASSSATSVQAVERANPLGRS